jgi:CHAT domain-containing protein
LAFNRLPETRTEIMQVAGLFSADRQTVRLGDQASEQSVKSEGLERATILHFATIGLAEGRVPTLDGPALVLAPSASEDGWLTSGEVARLQLTADFVIASGCNTYGAMADAFLRAGARSGLAVDGAVSDEVAAEFVTTLVTAAIEETNGDYVRAFQIARAKLRARPDNRYAHPAAWAQFGLFGDPPIARPDTAR